MILSDEAKRQKLLFQVSKWTINIEQVPYDRLIEHVVKRYNQRHKKQCNLSKNMVNPDTHNDFVERIAVNYIRHNFFEYDERLKRLGDKTGYEDAFILLNERIYDEISKKYPQLNRECHRQLTKKIIDIETQKIS